MRHQRTLDISINLISTADVQGTPLVKLELAGFERLIHNAMCSPCVTARAAGRHITGQGSGVISMFGCEGDPIGDRNGHLRPDVGALVDHERAARGTAAGGCTGARRLPGTVCGTPCSVVAYGDRGAACAIDHRFLADGRIVDEMAEPSAERVLDRMKRFGD